METNEIIEKTDVMTHNININIEKINQISSFLKTIDDKQSVELSSEQFIVFRDHIFMVHKELLLMYKVYQKLMNETKKRAIKK